jgi:rfaE bifunctional protein nucleotidyltransferase chain/domain
LQAESPKIMTVEQMRSERDRIVAEGKELLFTNGCFDILHRGHVTYLTFARDQGDALVVALNTDWSVKKNKGDDRPINNEVERAFVVGSLRSVDYVVFFDEDEPRELLAKLLPQVLVKGSDWAHYVSGREIVEANGGRVVLAEMVQGLSTTDTIKKVLRTYSNRGEQAKHSSPMPKA